MDDRKEATDVVQSAGSRWFGCAMKLVGLLLFGTLCALIGYGRGYLGTYGEADKQFAPIWTAAFYHPETRAVLLQQSGYKQHVGEAIDQTITSHGEAESYRIVRVDPGPAKTFIDVRVVRGGKTFNENLVFIARKIADFTSEPAMTP